MIEAQKQTTCLLISQLGHAGSKAWFLLTTLAPGNTLLPETTLTALGVEHRCSKRSASVLTASVCFDGLTESLDLCQKFPRMSLSGI